MVQMFAPNPSPGPSIGPQVDQVSWQGCRDFVDRRHLVGRPSAVEKFESGTDARSITALYLGMDRQLYEERSLLRGGLIYGRILVSSSDFQVRKFKFFLYNRFITIFLVAVRIYQVDSASPSHSTMSTVDPNQRFVDPLESTGLSLFIVSIVGGIVSLVVVGLRTFVRVRARNFSLDDGLMVGGLVSTVLNTEASDPQS